MNYIIKQSEREYLRELAKRQLEIANLPIMEQRKKRWYAHNRGETISPMVIFETKYCEADFLDLKCESELAKIIELELVRNITNFEKLNDDKVVENYIQIYWDIDIETFSLDMSEKYADDSIGYTTIQHLKELENSMHLIGETKRRVDKEGTYALKNAILEVIGDILDVKIKIPPSFNWAVSPSKKAEYLMGLESMMFAPYDCPDEFNELYRRLTEDAIETFAWLKAEGLLVLNNGNDYAGSGSYGFTDLLPTEECKKTGIITTKDLWVNLNSQETVGVSPDMYGEFYWPYYQKLAKEFGQVYYGCCEPTNPIWDKYLSTLDNLRKVSISPWADINFMAERLRGTNIVYSRKPSPNIVAYDRGFDAEAYREHIRESVIAARGCNLEVICRDVYSLSGDRQKLTTAVDIINEEIETYWMK